MPTWLIITNAINFVLLVAIACKIYSKHLRIPFWTKKKGNIEIAEYETFVHQLSHALKWMSKHKIGALIVIEREMKLSKYIELGYRLSAKLSAELLIAIFSNKNSALHDGGAIVRGLNIVSFASYFPVTQARLVSSMGARHRASIGLTEHTDAISFVVSETNGKITYSNSGKITELPGDINQISEEIFNLLNFYIN